MWCEVSLTCCGWRPGSVGESIAIVELGGIEGRARIELDSDREAAAWEKRVVEVAPHKTDQLYLEKGNTLLAEYHDVCAVADRCFDCVREFVASGRNVEDVYPLELRDQAEELSQSIGLCMVPELLPVYWVTVVIILANCGEVEEDPHLYDGIFPLHHKEFLSIVRIVVNETLMGREELMQTYPGEIQKRERQ